MNDNLKKIKYEGKFYEVDEEEFDHYHLKSVNVPIYKNEIKIRFGKAYSQYSLKKVKKDINKNIKDCIIKLEKLIKKLKENNYVK